MNLTDRIADHIRLHGECEIMPIAVALNLTFGEVYKVLRSEPDRFTRVEADAMSQPFRYATSSKGTP